jgi:signal recognition particle subunit SRP54
MFEGLSEKLQGAFRKLTGYGKLSEKNIADAMRDVRLALLEADVNFKVVKDFITRVKARAVGQEVLRSITPGQQVIKIVHDELVALMGGSAVGLDLSASPAVVMLVGLQGSGKTTLAGKLANMLRRKGRHPLMVACDTKRPAAIEQLVVLGKQLDMPVFADTAEPNAVKIAASSMRHAADRHFDVLVLDTAGRLHVDDELMRELEAIKAKLKPGEILLVADAMTGQDAVNIAQEFDRRLGITGAVLTKLDGDTRGGAALSIRAVTGKPIKLVGIGEKSSDLDVFYPDRLASRILGMGDVVTLVEKAQEQFTAEQAAKIEEKIRKHSLNLDDYLAQLQQIKKMGSIESVLAMIPGMGQAMKHMQIDDRQLGKVEAIIQSMTEQERRHPEILNGSRRTRIAQGSGTTVVDVNKLLKGFEQAKKMMKNMGKIQKGLMRMGGLKWHS